MYNQALSGVYKCESKVKKRSHLTVTWGPYRQEQPDWPTSTGCEATKPCLRPFSAPHSWTITIFTNRNSAEPVCVGGSTSPSLLSDYLLRYMLDAALHFIRKLPFSCQTQSSVCTLGYLFIIYVDLHLLYGCYKHDFVVLCDNDDKHSDLWPQSTKPSHVCPLSIKSVACDLPTAALITQEHFIMCTL